MRKLTVEQQIEILRRSVASGLANRFHWWLIGLSLVLAVVAVVAWHPVPLMIALFLGIVGVAERQAGPNLALAIKAFDDGEASNGIASITIVGGDTTDHYHARIQEEGQPDAEFEFIPHRWKPVEGSFPARIWRPDDGGIPVLATIDEGVLIPRRR